MKSLYESDLFKMTNGIIDYIYREKQSVIINQKLNLDN